MSSSVVSFIVVGCVALSACGSSDPPIVPPSPGGGASGSEASGGSGGASAGGAGAGAGAATGGTSAAGATGSGGAAGAPGGASAGAGQPATSGAGSGSGGVGGSGGSSSTADVTIIPDASWTCGMPEGIVPPTRGKLVVQAELKLGETHDVGATPLGHRRVLDVTGGSMSGDGVSASVLTGGLELELQLSNGATELEQIHILRATDGTLMLLRTCGVAPANEAVERVVADLEVSQTSSLARLGTLPLVGTRTLDEQGGKVTLALYDVSDVSTDGPQLKLQDPKGEPQQTWECATGSGSQGPSVFTETVTLGSSLAVGQAKHGNRNIIPITGGTMSGKVQGKVLPGGADYQIVSGNTRLDARYTLETSDGELIVVRNCGAFGALIPIFEARAAGPYAFLNEGKYLSSNPGSAAGGVSITFYERN